jgi:hypothetical protein
MFQWRAHGKPEVEHGTAWGIFPGTHYFDPSAAPFMINYIVDDLDALLARLSASGVQIDPKREDYDDGRRTAESTGRLARFRAQQTFARRRSHSLGPSSGPAIDAAHRITAQPQRCPHRARDVPGACGPRRGATAFSNISGTLPESRRERRLARVSMSTWNAFGCVSAIQPNVEALSGLV